MSNTVTNDLGANEMKLDGDTKILLLIDKYPKVYEALYKISNKVQRLKDPIARKTVGKSATLTMVSVMLGIPLETLISTIQNAIEANKIDPTQNRKELLKKYILDMHKGMDIELLKTRVKETLGDISASELGDVEQELIDAGLLDTNEIAKQSDIHVELIQDVLGDKSDYEPAPGHPVHTYMQENIIALNLIRQIKSVKGTDKLKLFQELTKIEIHYTRKENQLFPLLEKYGISGPGQVMWAVHNEIRAMLKTGNIEEIDPAVKKVEDMVYKEENILFPMTLETFEEEDWIEVFNGEEEIGYIWGVTPGNEWKPTQDVLVKKSTKVTVPVDSLNLSIGNLTLKQIDVMLTTLPVDITFVDENDEVAYYSATDDRIFPRSRAIIGRKVQKCHPPSSVHVVEDILKRFKTGEKSVAEFWIQLDKQFVMIRYYAMRDDEGNYLGTLEVSQDLSRLQEIDGERRLAQWF